jgi:two-component system NarL family sensor kinase
MSLNTVMVRILRKAERTHKTAITGTRFRLPPISALNPRFGKISRLIGRCGPYPGPSGELEAYFRISWLFVAAGFALAVLFSVIYVSMRKARKREAEQLLMSAEAIAAQEAERRRIYMELHDDILPRFEDRKLAARLRLICADLMPPDFSRLPLSGALASLCAAFTRKTGILCEYDIKNEIDSFPVSEQDRLHIYRIAQEAFNNIAKHSGASRATFAAGRQNREDGPRMVLFISDEGAGLTAKSRGMDIIRPKVIGPSVLRQRAAIIGAKLDFIDQEGGGCVVRLEIPEGKPLGGVMPNHSIVIIEDEPVMRKALSAWFAGTGRWLVYGSAASLDAAKTLLSGPAKETDIVLLDIRLETEWGLDLIPWLKSQTGSAAAIPAEDAQWAGLSEIAASKAKSTAVAKAEKLLAFLK